MVHSHVEDIVKRAFSRAISEVLMKHNVYATLPERVSHLTNDKVSMLLESYKLDDITHDELRTSLRELVDPSLSQLYDNHRQINSALVEDNPTDEAIRDKLIDFPIMDKELEGDLRHVLEHRYYDADYRAKLLEKFDYIGSKRTEELFPSLTVKTSIADLSMVLQRDDIEPYPEVVLDPVDLSSRDFIQVQHVAFKPIMENSALMDPYFYLEGAKEGIEYMELLSWITSIIGDVQSILPFMHYSASLLKERRSVLDHTEKTKKVLASYIQETTKVKDENGRVVVDKRHVVNMRIKLCKELSELIS